jgi:hypothetical protein
MRPWQRFQGQHIWPTLFLGTVPVRVGARHAVPWVGDAKEKKCALKDAREMGQKRAFLWSDGQGHGMPCPYTNRNRDFVGMTGRGLQVGENAIVKKPPNCAGLGNAFDRMTLTPSFPYNNESEIIRDVAFISNDAPSEIQEIDSKEEKT